MKTDRQTIITDLSAHRDMEEAGCHPGFLDPVVFSLDQTPVKPMRSSCREVDCPDEAGNASNSQFFSLTDDERIVDHHGGVSAADCNDSVSDASSSTMESSWHHIDFDTSLRNEDLGLLHGVQDICDSLELFVGECTIPSSTQVRAAFRRDSNDTPPQLAMRKHSSVDFSKY